MAVVACELSEGAMAMARHYGSLGRDEGERERGRESERE